MDRNFLDKLGAAGSVVVAAAFCPACLPLLGSVGAALGLGAFQPYEGVMRWLFQAFVMIAVAGTGWAYRSHRRVLPLGIAVASAVLAFYAIHFRLSEPVLYSALAGLVVAAIFNMVYRKRTCGSCGSASISDAKLRSVITCPECGHTQEEEMPTNACLFFYECVKCGVRLSPKRGDCCVFCSYGSVPCPSVQQGGRLTTTM